MWFLRGFEFRSTTSDEDVVEGQVHCAADRHETEHIELEDADPREHLTIEGGIRHVKHLELDANCQYLGQ